MILNYNQNAHTIYLGSGYTHRMLQVFLFVQWEELHKFKCTHPSLISFTEYLLELFSAVSLMGMHFLCIYSYILLLLLYINTSRSVIKYFPNFLLHSLRLTIFILS